MLMVVMIVFKSGHPVLANATQSVVIPSLDYFYKDKEPSAVTGILI